MPIELCPWMAARCPHHTAKCTDEKSKHCFYVKNSTATALAALRQLKASAQQQNPVDPDLQRQIDDVEGFLNTTPDP